MLTRTFTYDSLGRRLGTTDPDSDSRNPARTAANRSWRYLYNRVGDLAAVRDPRGCGQDFYYDYAGRLLGEDYITGYVGLHHGVRREDAAGFGARVGLRCSGGGRFLDWRGGSQCELGSSAR